MRNTNTRTKYRWDRIEQILDTVLEADFHQWSIILDETCGNDTALRREVEKYLRHYRHIDSFLQQPVGEQILKHLSSDSDPIHENDRIGRYRILREIAQGGMGHVFLAERSDGEYRQQVALKLLRSNLDSKTMQSRFRIERQILASLNHPNIARLLDGGVITKTSGRGVTQPYLVMEYVDGIPITEYCEKRKLQTYERLRLFLKAAEAIHYAHRNLVVHCDIKPSNILVTHDGEVKLLDFGISRLLEGETHNTISFSTRTIRHWMTPEYAAPEQIRGERPTTAVDVYQLGVLLYELLAGKLPFQGTGENLRDLEHKILEKDPVKPSLISSSGDARRIIHGDLDAIVLKALRKEPEARYESAATLTDDIRRFLAGKPVTARHGTLGYRAGKFIRRHRMAAFASIGVLLLLVTVTGFYTHRLTIERDRAEQAASVAQIEALKAEKVADFMVNLFETADPYRRAGDEPTIRDFLERAVERIDNELDGEPVVQAQLLMTLGHSYANLGLFDRAEPLLRKALDLNIREFGNDHRETAGSMNRLARLHYRRGELDSARSLLEEALEIQERTLGPDHADIIHTINVLGNLYKRIGELSKSRITLERCLELVEQHLGTDHVRYGTTLNDYALLLMILGEHTTARDAFLRVVSIMEREFGPDHLYVGEALGNLSDVQGALGEHEERIKNSERYLEIAENELGPSHPTVATALTNVGMAYRSMGRSLDAIHMFERAANIYTETSGPGHHLVAYPLAHLGHTYRDMGDVDRAVAFYDRAIGIAEENQTLPHLAGILIARARVRMSTENPGLALPDLMRSLDLYHRIHTDGHWRIGWTRSLIGECLTQLNRYEEAELYLVEGYESLKSRRGMENSLTQDAVRRLVALYDLQKLSDRADQFRSMLAQFASEE
jgi:eukaryotic-like serine/threonine-protein kinase